MTAVNANWCPPPPPPAHKGGAARQASLRQTDDCRKLSASGESGCLSSPITDRHWQYRHQWGEEAVLEMSGLSLQPHASGLGTCPENLPCASNWSFYWSFISSTFSQRRTYVDQYKAKETSPDSIFAWSIYCNDQPSSLIKRLENIVWNITGVVWHFCRCLSKHITYKIFRILSLRANEDLLHILELKQSGNKSLL